MDANRQELLQVLEAVSTDIEQFLIIMDYMEELYQRELHEPLAFRTLMCLLTPVCKSTIYEAACQFLFSTWILCKDCASKQVQNRSVAMFILLKGSLCNDSHP